MTIYKSLKEPEKIQPDDIKKARIAAKLTQESAARVLGVKWSTWTAWEVGRNSMHPCYMELFKIKTEQHPVYGCIAESEFKNQAIDQIKEALSMLERTEDEVI